MTQHHPHPHLHLAGDGTKAHPVDALLAEHQVILAVLEAMENRLALDAAQNRPDPDFWPKVVEFLRQFADNCHHGKEEGFLFPALVAAGVPDEGGPVGVMKLEHVEGRELITKIEHAAKANDLPGVRAAARGYVALLRPHIDKENNVLFPIAKSSFTPQVVQSVLAGFESVERDVVGEGTHCRYLGIAQELCESVGVHLEEERGNSWSAGGCCGHQHKDSVH